MSFECTKCGTEFSRATAVCENPRDPARSFGCPNCGAFFMRDPRDLQGKEAVKRAVLSGGVLLPACLILGNSIYIDTPPSPLLSVAIIASTFFLIQDPPLDFLKKWIPSGEKATFD